VEHYHIPVIAGVIKDVNPRTIPDGKAQSANNITFEKARFQSRWGYAQFGGNLPLNGEIMAIERYEEIDSGTKHIMAFTPKDQWRYNTNTGKWDFATKVYTTGTIASISSTTINGTGSPAWNTGISSTNLEIRFGTKDPSTATITAISTSGDGFTSEWHVVSSVDSATTMTVSVAPSATYTGVYVIREQMSGDIDNQISTSIPFDDGATTLDKVMVVTNGIEAPGMIEKSNQMVDLAGSPNVARFNAYFGSVGFEHLILGGVIDSGTNYWQRIETTDAGEIENWSTNTANYELLDTNDEIVGFERLRNRMMVYKQESITEMSADPSGSNTDPFNFVQNKIHSIGTSSARTVVNFGDFHIFLGSNNNVYMFDGVNLRPIGDEITNEITDDMNKDKSDHAFAFGMLEEDLYALFIPIAEEGAFTDATCDVATSTTVTCDSTALLKRGMLVSDNVNRIPASTKITSIDSATQFTMNNKGTATGTDVTLTFKQDKIYPSRCYVYNIKEKHWTIWNPHHQMTAMGIYNKSFNPSWTSYASSGETWDDVSMRWTDLLLVEEQERYLMGDKDGYIYDFSNTTNTDDGNNNTYQVVTKDYPINDPKHTIRVVELALGLEKTKDVNGDVITTNLQVEASVDFGANWSTAATVTETWLSGGTEVAEDFKQVVINFLERGRQVRFRITNVSGAPFNLEALTIGFNQVGGKVK
jgi:hypothetical protein